jgi:hypothetical protein
LDLGAVNVWAACKKQIILPNNRTIDNNPRTRMQLREFYQLAIVTALMSVVGVRRAKAALSSGCKPHPAIAPAGSNRSSHGGNEVTEAFD